MTIEAFTGLPGQGKTYSMSAKALDKMRKGKRVFANYALEGAERFKELSDLQGVKSALICIDEAGIYLPSQAWRDIPFEFIRQIRQHRHDGLDLWYTAQDMGDVATYLRKITQFEHQYQKMWRFYLCKTVNPRTHAKYGFELGIFDFKYVGSKYDTTENIDFGEYLKKNLIKQAK